MIFQELKALKRLDHPYVVPLHLCFHDNISIYMIFDLKLGGDLRHFLKHNGMTFKLYILLNFVIKDIYLFSKPCI